MSLEDDMKQGCLAAGSYQFFATSSMDGVKPEISSSFSRIASFSPAFRTTSISITGGYQKAATIL